tara:strand:- start:288 stop:776 length:489 start_codon:yes stop_codon:yes gene_type:complete
MNLLRLSLFFFSLNSFSGVTLITESVNEFTDEKQIALGIIGDNHNEFLNEAIIIRCGEQKPPVLLLKIPTSSTKPVLSVTLRFDKYESEVHIFKNARDIDMLLTGDKFFIQKFLDNLANSNNLILQIQGQAIDRFTGLVESRTHVAMFKKSASENAFNCDIF